MEPLSLQTFYADIEAARVANLPVELTSRSLLQGDVPLIVKTASGLTSINVSNLN